MKKWLVTMLLAAFAATLCVDQAAAQEKKGKKKKAPDLEKVFKRLDKDSDGKLTFDEFKGKREGKGAERAEKFFKKLDKNSDKTLSLEEFKDRPERKPKKKKGDKSDE